MRLVTAVFLALYLVTGANAASRAPGPYSTPFANPNTPVIKLTVGHSMSLDSAHWRANQRIRCTGNHDALNSGIPGFLGTHLVPAARFVGHSMTLRHNHGLELSLVEKADHSIVVSCASHG
jgi:hypothetical protein